MADKTRRERAIALLEHWWHSQERAVVKPQHALVTVQELHMTEATGGAMGGSQRRTSGSRPPIRDMDDTATWFNPIMEHVSQVEPSWRKALEAMVEHATIQRAATARRVTAAQMYRDFQLGLAVVQSELVRRGY